MVRALNRLILFLVIASGVYCFYVYNDIDNRIPFVKETIWSVTAVLGILLLLKINYKWQSLFYIKKRQKDILYCYDVGSDLRRRTILYEMLDIITYGVIGGMLLLYPHPGKFIGVLLCIAALEGVIYFLANRKRFRIGVTSKAVILATNRPNIIRISKLKAIINKSGHYDFQYLDGRVYKLERPWVSSTSRPLFNEVIKNLTKEKEIFCDDFSEVRS